METKRIINHTYILEQFSHLYERIDMLEKLAGYEALVGYGDSETHFIDAVGNIESPNVTNIAHKLTMTTGAISKIAKKLISKDLIYRYKNKDNKKEVFFGLTDKGKVVFEAHTKRHNEWKKRDSLFFDTIKPSDLLVVSDFLTKFNSYLDENIELKLKR